ncbi:MAG: glycerophosphodiester phosphodiesterase [Acidimicrobiia bacterium]|nr:glycerophosphodiester phosphodiesterase [Acidimicrobiia bacterium]
MRQRLPSLLRPPLAFAHRGARAHAPENTLEAFRLAMRLGATGLESDVWPTSDGVAVLDHDGVVRSGLRRKRISELERAALPEHIPTLRELYDEVGPEVPLSLDVKDPAVAPEVIACARDVGAEADLWLCHPDLDTVASWRPLSAEVRLVHSTRRKRLGMSPEHHAAELQQRQIDAANFHHSEWTGGTITLYHRFGRLALGWDAQFERIIDDLLDGGIDGVFSDHVDRLVTCFQQRGAW